MRLKSFQIQHYRSISDTGVVQLSERDNVTVLAGQNESGKSSILGALRDYENEDFRDGSAPFSTEESADQVVSCTYKIESSDDLTQLLNDIAIEDHKIEVEDGEVILDANKIKRIREFTITRTKTDGEISISIDDTTFKIFCSAILEKDKAPAENAVGEAAPAPIEKVSYFPLSDEDNNTVASIFWRTTPPIVFFDDFCDLLPDRILLSDLKNKKTDARGYKAVRNLEKILGTDFVDKETESDAVRRTKESKENDTITVDFQSDWGQRIHDENKVVVKYNFEKRDGEADKGSYVNFYVETKEGQPLPPQQRSKGLIWFLSLWLELKAQDAEHDNLVLLLDEPDQHLHVKAQKDILKLINRLATKEGDQIIYATHSPYLLEVNHLNRIKLVINNEREGTTVEDVTTSKIDTESKKDALQPIADAIGFHASELSPLGERNALLEGVSDFYYFTAMRDLLKRRKDYNFVPGIGVRKINSLISMCIGYGLPWVAIIDDDPQIGGTDSLRKFEEIKNFVFDGDASKAKEVVHTPSGVVGIENMLTHDDLKLIDPKVTNNADKTISVGAKRKVLFAKTFYEKVKSKEIKEANLSKTCKDKFGKAFDFIESAFPAVTKQ